MGYLFTRHHLHELVWAGPISTLTKSLELPDVGLAKACRRGDIPLPPRGYWAKLNAGKRWRLVAGNGQADSPEPLTRKRKPWATVLQQA